MSPYVPTSWAKRISQFPDRYTLTDLGGGLYTIVPSEGNVTQEGAPLSEANLNNLETQYDEAVADAVTKIRKTADETVNNSDVLQDDDELLKAVGANEVWWIDMLLLAVSATTTPDINLGFTIPAGATLRSYVKFGFITSSSVDATTSGSAFQVDASGGSYYHTYLLYIGGANAGTIQLQWAQWVATAEDTKILANSFMLCHKLA